MTSQFLLCKENHFEKEKDNLTVAMLMHEWPYGIVGCSSDMG